MAKLLVIVSYKIFPPLMGGQKGIVHFYEHLRHHHSVVMVVSSDNEAVITGYRIERMLYNHRRMGYNLLQLQKLKRIIREEGVEAIIAEHSYTGWIAWLLKKWTRIPFVIHSHNMEASRFRQMGKKGWRMYQPYEKWIHQQADFSFFKTEEDRDFAITNFQLQPAQCSVIPYGFNKSSQRITSWEKLQQRYTIHSRYFFYFNGTLNYRPNEEAVKRIIDTINPALNISGMDYTILISGKNLSPFLQQQIENSKRICYLEYVDDVDEIYQACTLFINPVINDSGVKTKLVEALANGCTVISTQSGATGIPKETGGQKLITTKDGDWTAFVLAILANSVVDSGDLPSHFFSYFSWPNITQKAASQLDEIINHA